MLYVINQQDHSDLDYSGGQKPILHLQADLKKTVKWAEAENIRWAFSLGNAASRGTEFRRNLSELDELNWDAIRSQWWSESRIKEAKQAEFLIESYFAWELVEQIGVYSSQMQSSVLNMISASTHRPLVSVYPDWYY